MLQTGEPNPAKCKPIMNKTYCRLKIYFKV